MRTFSACLIRLVCGCVIGANVASAQAQPPAQRTLRQEFTIGDGATGDSQFALIVDVEVAPNGEMFVLDYTDFAVKVFDANGRFVRRFGRKGSGPGEFTGPATVALRDGEIVVRERLARKEHHFSLDGRYLRTTPHAPLVVTEQRTSVRGGATLVQYTPSIGMGPDVQPRQIWRIVTLERSGRRQIDTLFRIRADTVFIRREGFDTYSARPSAFGAGGAWALSGDSLLAYANGYTGSVTWYALGADGAAPVRKDTLWRAGTAVTGNDVAVEADRQRRITGISGTMSGGQLVRSSRGPMEVQAAPTHRSIASKAFFAADGALWVSDSRQILEKNEPGLAPWRWTVFPPSGAAFTVQLPASFILRAVIGNRIYGNDSSRDGEPIVTVYSINP